MAYLVVENFLGGLDTRRHVLASKPGTLARLKNAHITRGGEIEKRKAFTVFAALPAGTFGLEAAGGQLWCFGSAVEPAGLPASILYKRLQHPDGIAMTALISGCAYSSKTFVIAEFLDGSRYGFYDGVIVADFVNGVARASMTNINGFATHLRSLFPSGGFTASGTGSGVLINGPVGEPYSISATTDGTITAATSTITQAVAAIPEAPASGSFVIYAGEETPSKKIWTLRFNDYPYFNPANMGISAIYVAGVDILGLAPGSVIYWDSYNQTVNNDRGQKMAKTLAYYINQNSPQSGFTAEAQMSNGWSGPDVGYLKLYADPQRGAAPNGDVIEIEFNGNPPNTDFGELYQDNTRQVSPYRTGTHTYHTVTAGTLSSGVFSGITSVKIDGVEVLGAEVAWKSSHSQTAVDVADQINSYTSSTEYTAIELEGGKVKLTAASGLGASPNGKLIQVSVAGTAGVQNIAQLSGGKDAIGGVSQQVSVNLGGTFSTGSKVTIMLTPEDSPDYPVQIGATRVGGSKPVHVMTYKSKVHLLSEQYFFSSALDNPQKWDDVSIGTSVIDMSNNIEGSEELVGATSYQGKVAIFGRRSCQVWNIDVDPAKNFQAQVLQNTGALSPNGIISFGEIDSFYLPDSGMRSLRSRDSSTNAYASDVGMPIDTLIVDDIRLNLSAARAAVCAIEPLDSRLMLAIGTKIYVLSQFLGSSISAWSTYETGFVSERMTVLDGRLYVRSGNNIYLYGGENNNTYDTSDVEVVLPYLDGNKPAHSKSAMGIDMTIDGTWTIELGMDPFAPEARDVVATASSSTFSLGRIPAVGQGTHFGLRLTSTSNGYARLANVFVHYELNEAD